MSFWRVFAAVVAVVAACFLLCAWNDVSNKLEQISGRMLQIKQNSYTYETVRSLLGADGGPARVITKDFHLPGMVIYATDSFVFMAVSDRNNAPPRTVMIPWSSIMCLQSLDDDELPEPLRRMSSGTRK